MKWLDNTLLTLAVIGCINWGLIGFFNFNLVESLFGVQSTITNIIYAIVGICALINIGLLFKDFDSIEK